MNILTDDDIRDVVSFYNDADNQTRLRSFQSSVESSFHNTNLNGIVHSIKTRLKDPEHLRDKIKRKFEEDNNRIITKDNLFKEVTDLIGVRVLHLHQEQFTDIHKSILNNVENGDWAFVEKPKAYTWDPEYEKFYKQLNINTEVNNRFYTSVHYVVKPNNQNPNPICCEIQVRTLFEEIWGEIDHSINYPHPTNSTACKEQIKVLARLVSAGTRLADSIFRSQKEHEKTKKDIS